MTSLSVRHLSLRRNGRDVLSDVSFELAAGTFVGLIGPNGAGKSTLLRALLQLLPASGNVEVDGVPVAGLGQDARAKLFSYLPQERNVAWPLTVEEVVGLGRLPHRTLFGGESGEDRIAVEEAMRAAEVDDLRSRSIAELSGGERSRVLIARALAQETPILLADEPTSGLDPAHQISLMRVLAERARRGAIVIVSLHELSLAARWCQRLILLADGRVVADGTADAVLSEETLKAVYGVSAYVARNENGLIVQALDRI